MAYRAQQITDWILSRIDSDAGDIISPLKLQKLLYYCQAWHYTIFDEILFDENIQAWSHGPVVVSQYHRFKDLMMNEVINIKDLNIKVPKFPERTENLLKEVMSIYGEHSAYYLEQLTHKERPWKETRGNLEPYAASNKVIPLELMKEYYSYVNNA